MNKTVYVLSLGAAVLMACSHESQTREPLTAQEAAAKVRDSWAEGRKPVSIALFSEHGRPVTELPSIGVHATMRDCTDSERAALCGVPFARRTDNYVSSDSNALCSDSAAAISVCYPWHEGATPDTAILLSAPFGENLYGKELSRMAGSSIRVDVQMKSSMALLRVTTNSDDIQDLLETLHISGDAICTETMYKPYTGQWLDTKADGSITATDADCLLNNGRPHAFYLVPTDRSGEVTLLASVSGRTYSVRTTLPRMTAGSLIQLNLRKKGNAMSVESSWVETARPVAYDGRQAVDCVMVGHFLQKDGRVTAAKDSSSVAVVIETDGRHGKAVALYDADGRFCFSDKCVSSGKTFPTLDGKRKEGVVNLRQSDDVDDDERIIFKSDMPYSDNVALGYGNGARLTQTLLVRQGEFSLAHVFSQVHTGFSLPCTSMLKEVSKHPCSYVPTLREMVMLYCAPPKGIAALHGEYITCSESGGKTCYMIDMDCGIVSASASKQYGKLQLRLFYLF